MKTRSKQVWNTITTALVALVVALALALVGARLMGLRVFTVLSGSMEPEYPVGALIWVKAVEATQLKKGDVITFLLNEDTVATHRITEVVYDGGDLRFRTKGDANEAEDGALVHHKNVIGTPVLTVKRLGHLIRYIQTPPGTYIAITAGALLLLGVVLPDLFASPNKKEEQYES